MSEVSIAEKNIKRLKLRLESAINDRSELEREFSSQSVLLSNFIVKLSQACKGIDILLDNKLANLRTTLKKSTNFTDLEKEIKTISALLQKHSLQNDKNIIKIHEQLHASNASLQKVKNLPKDHHLQLKTLISRTQSSQNTLVQYVPLMSEFIACYENALQAQISEPPLGSPSAKSLVTGNKINKVDTDNLADINPLTEQVAPKEVLGRFSSILNTLVISEKHKADILKIKSTLKGKVSNKVLMTKCLSVFDLIIEDLKQERSTAKIFLSTLSETLTSVQASVSSTISSTLESNVKNDQLNKELTEKINEMSVGITGAGSLADIKDDVNEKLLQITKTLEKKTKLEEQQKAALLDKLNATSAKVDHLELQSQTFEKRILAEQTKSMQDALTKLSNRAAFDEYFAKEIVRQYHNEFDLAIAVADLDNFKRINDTYGHSAGDKTLQVIANTLTKVIGEDAFICRYGGEEFVLIFSNQDKTSVINKLNILRKKVEKLPFTFKGTRVSITISTGVTLVQKDDNVHSAFERADTALYQAKHEGKNRVIYG
jgi:diguanylate cyclase (GGDEF)-like protein